MTDRRMTPREIADKLTPAQVRALRENDRSSFSACRMVWWLGLRDNGGKVTHLGRAVLACLDGEVGG